MRSYMNAAQDLMDCFEECKFNLIPRLQNFLDNSIATSFVVFKTPLHPNRKYEIEVMYRPSVLDNVKSWQAFEDDKQIQKFLTLTREFDGLNIDEYNGILEEASPTQEPFPNQFALPKKCQEMSRIQ